MTPRFTIFCCSFAVVFGFSLYLLACTASIYSDYQPDIGRIRWFHPALVLILFFIAAWFPLVSWYRGGGILDCDYCDRPGDSFIVKSMKEKYGLN